MDVFEAQPRRMVYKAEGAAICRDKSRYKERIEDGNRKIEKDRPNEENKRKKSDRESGRERETNGRNIKRNKGK